jgi:hydroxymethylpyrimidine kinase/phosphomethylpyrimidine kinase
MIKKQLEAVFEDIFPAAVKIGMLSTLEAVETAADCLEKYHAANVVLDPVLVSTSGRSLLAPEAGRCMRERLFPLACLITPNIPEMEEILGWQKGEIRNHSSMERAAAVFHERYGCDVLLKGGHGKEGADDLLYQKEAVWYPSERIPTTNTHGTGCTLSSAIACGLSLGRPLSLAVAGAKQYVRGAMSSGLDLGKGNGPLEHGWQRERDSTPSKV